MSSSTFPAEVIDLVVREISHFPDDAVRVKTLSAAALVSWYFRHRAHARLFYDIHIRDRYYPNVSGADQARRFLALINADPHSDGTGIASYVRTFTLSLSGSTNKVRRVLDDGTAAAILRKIFRTTDVGHRSLSLSFVVLGNLRNVFDWESLNPDFLSAFHDLCRNPLLTTLHLAHFENLPRTLLHHSFIKNVRFSRLHLAGTDSGEEDIPEPLREFKDDEEIDIGALEEGQAVPLESIETDHSLPLLDVIDMTPRHVLHPRLAFSQLKRLTAHIGNEGDFHKTRWILTNAASTLTELDVILFAFDSLPEPEWKTTIAELPALKSISIVQNSTSYKSPGRTSIPQICTFMNHMKLHPQLEEVKIKLLLYTQRSAKTPVEIFDGHNFSPLGELFGHGRFLGMKRLTIRVMFNIYANGNEKVDHEHIRVKGVDYVQKSFSEVSDRVELNIDILPHIRRS